MPVLRLAKRSLTWLGAAGLLFATALPVAAADDAAGEAWKFDAQVYLWGAGINADTVEGDEIDVGFSTLLKNLDMAFMGSLAARKDGWMLFGDLIYMDLSADTTGTGNIVGIPAKTKFELDFTTTIASFGGGRSVFENDATQIELLAGARYLKVQPGLTFEVGPAQRKASSSDTVWDGFVAVRGETNINEKWYINYYADVGTGQSTSTWQALGSVGYRFSKVDAILGYRHLQWNLDDSRLLDNLAISGPFAGVRWHF